jgi:integrase
MKDRKTHRRKAEAIYVRNDGYRQEEDTLVLSKDLHVPFKAGELWIGKQGRLEPTKACTHGQEDPRQPENPSFNQALSDIVTFGLWMQRSAYRPSTVTSCVKTLKALARRSHISDPESVKAYLVSAKMGENRKQTVVDHLARFYKWKKIPFIRPNYKRIELLPFIPLESEIDQLISGLRPKWATFLQLMKETACRPGEAWALRWIDIDRERSCLRISPEKNSRPRQFKISSQLASMLGRLQHKWDYAFHDPRRDPIESLDDFRRTFIRQRSRMAEKLHNPRILQITFGTLRHFKATMEYYRTKDILHVMQLLGHRSIKNTLIYTHLASFDADEYICKVAATVDEAKNLVEHAFEYVTDVDGMKLFRIRK